MSSKELSVSSLRLIVRYRLPKHSQWHHLFVTLLRGVFPKMIPFLGISAMRLSACPPPPAPPSGVATVSHSHDFFGTVDTTDSLHDTSHPCLGWKRHSVGIKLAAPVGKAAAWTTARPVPFLYMSIDIHFKTWHFYICVLGTRQKTENKKITQVNMNGFFLYGHSIYIRRGKNIPSNNTFYKLIWIWSSPI